MKNIAYKTSKGNQNLPDGFITDDHFETDNDQEEGYTVVSKDNFSQLIANNANLMAAFESSKGIVTVDSTVAVTPPPTKTVEALSPTVKAEQKAILDQSSDAALFQQFLAWKNSQTNNS